MRGVTRARRCDFFSWSAKTARRRSVLRVWPPSTTSASPHSRSSRGGVRRQQRRWRRLNRHRSTVVSLPLRVTTGVSRADLVFRHGGVGRRGQQIPLMQLGPIKYETIPTATATPTRTATPRPEPSATFTAGRRRPRLESRHGTHRRMSGRPCGTGGSTAGSAGLVPFLFAGAALRTWIRIAVVAGRKIFRPNVPARRHGRDGTRAALPGRGVRRSGTFQFVSRSVASRISLGSGGLLLGRRGPWRELGARSGRGAAARSGPPPHRPHESVRLHVDGKLAKLPGHLRHSIALMAAGEGKRTGKSRCRAPQAARTKNSTNSATSSRRSGERARESGKDVQPIEEIGAKGCP